MNIISFTEKMERGQYPVNVPTSLALESFMGIHPDFKRDSPPSFNYDEYWLNARTLYRNIVSSYTSDISILLNPGVIAELMQDEWEAIKRVLSDTKVQPTLFLCNYKDITSRYRHHTTFKLDSTTKQMDERKRMEKSIQQFIDDVGEGYFMPFKTDIHPQHKDGKFMIQTHIAFDLLSWKHFEELDLLESHTGAIKNRSLWYTKYNNGKELSMIPFTQYFLRIFGDKEFFTPMDSSIRKAIVELAQKYSWGPLTTDAKVRMNLDQLKDPYMKALIKDMM
jgi:hypothetical protein